MAALPTLIAAGSSPRVRGKHCERYPRVVTGRLIPACAGKTDLTRTHNPAYRAHPRVCGENDHNAKDMPHRVGSSPRVRGKLPLSGDLEESGRLIPACAGKTGARRCPIPNRGAHPRVCGENLASTSPLSPAAGSSPRVRGKPRSLRARNMVAGLIPACAGKTPRPSGSDTVIGAHPRVCGENCIGNAGGDLEAGSSPRVRGKRLWSRPPTLTGRLIPACAGKTEYLGFCASDPWAHPRVCGENSVHT